MCVYTFFYPISISVFISFFSMTIFLHCSLDYLPLLIKCLFLTTVVLAIRKQMSQYILCNFRCSCVLEHLYFVIFNFIIWISFSYDHLFNLYLIALWLAFIQYTAVYQALRIVNWSSLLKECEPVNHHMKVCRSRWFHSFSSFFLIILSHHSYS